MSGHPPREHDLELQLEPFLAQVAVHFLRQPSERIDGEVEQALASLTNILRVDCCALALFSPGLSELRLEHGFARPGTPALAGEDLALAYPWYAQQLRE